MLNNLLHIVWNADPVMFTIGGFELRYYGLMWALTFLIGERFFTNYIRREGFGSQVVETGFVWIVLGAVLGARVGHCLFYEFDYYITKPWAILTEFRNGGMASHGSAIGMLLGMWITCHKHRMPYVWWLDRIMIPVTIGGALVRIGNLINSEIVGKVTDLPWGFKFVRLYPNMPVSMIPPQHPAQLYEALCYLVTFVILCVMYYKFDMARRKPGIMFGIGVLGVFATRPFIELVKVNQEAFEEGMLFNMGQLLSVPFIILALTVIWLGMKDRLPSGRPDCAANMPEKEQKGNSNKRK